METKKKDAPQNQQIPEVRYSCTLFLTNVTSLRASSPIWASEASLARTRERGASRLRRSLARSTGELAIGAIGELTRKLQCD